MPSIDPASARELRGLLQQREAELGRAIARERGESSERSAELGAAVHDRGDEAVADVLADTQGALASRHYEEWRAALAALERLDRGEYGDCSDCGEPIALARLRASPAAERCVGCQERWDHSHAHPSHPAL